MAHDHKNTDPRGYLTLDLVRQKLAALGCEVSERQLRDWREIGLLPPIKVLVRKAGRGTTTLCPEETVPIASYIDALLRHGWNREGILILLWLHDHWWLRKLPERVADSARRKGLKPWQKVTAAVLGLLNKSRGLFPREGDWELPRLKELSTRVVVRKRRGRPRAKARAKIEEVYRLARTMRDGSFPPPQKAKRATLDSILSALKPRRGIPIQRFVELAARFQVTLPYYLSLPVLIDAVERVGEKEIEQAQHDTRVLVLGYLAVKESIYRRFGRFPRFPEDSVLAIATGVAIAARQRGFGPVLNELAELFASHPGLNIWRERERAGSAKTREV